MALPHLTGEPMTKMSPPDLREYGLHLIGGDYQNGIRIWTYTDHEPDTEELFEEEDQE